MEHPPTEPLTDDDCVGDGDGNGHCHAHGHDHGNGHGDCPGHCDGDCDDTDINLTFGQLKDIVNRALEGTLEFTREKTDGQALAVSWRDGRLVAARNKGHLKNKGENALDIKGVSDKFQGRGGLSDAYNFAMKDLSKAISSLSDAQRKKVFKEGACFMNLEVIYPTSVNVINAAELIILFLLST